jgi:metallo-beta-lactamase family protein
MKVKFCGAAQEVTGSCHVIEINGHKVALDAGMFQGHRQDADEKNHHPLIKPEELDAVVLSHAHVDHCGLLPLFYARGFKGKVYATSATVDLANYILRDAAFIQEHNAKQFNKRHKHRNYVAPLYTQRDAEGVIGLFEPKNFQEEFEVVPGMKVRFREAGHILGSAQVEAWLEEDDRKLKLYFTGDLGRDNMPIIADPERIEEAEVAIVESTYGNREHAKYKIARGVFLDTIRDTIARGGKVIIPSFAMERTQEIVYLLHEAFLNKEIPEIPVYIDSPLATNVTDVFRKHDELYDEETVEAFKQDDPFGFGHLIYTNSVEDSKKLNTSNEPMVIISASGMCEAGRILHHLEFGISNPKNTILIVGFMAEGTLGRSIVEKKPTVKIFGIEHPLTAQVKIFNNFSAHADHVEEIEHLRSTKGIQKVFVVHGEATAADAMAEQVRTELNISDVIIPRRGDEFEL